MTNTPVFSFTAGLPSSQSNPFAGPPAGPGLPSPDAAIPSVEVDAVTPSVVETATEEIVTTEDSSRADTALIWKPSVTVSPPQSPPPQSPPPPILFPSAIFPSASSFAFQPRQATPRRSASPRSSSYFRSASKPRFTSTSSLGMPGFGMSGLASALDDVERGADEQLPQSPQTARLQGTPLRLRSRSRSNSPLPPPQLPYNGEDEELPPHRLHEPAIQDGFADAKAAMGSLAGVLGSGKLHRDTGSTIHRLHGQAQLLADFQCSATRTVGFIGDAGIGKSSLLNALLDHKDLARSGNSGSACTCVVTEYHYHDREDFCLDVELFSLDELKNQATDLLTAYRYYHLRASSTTDEDMSHAKKAAKKAIDTFTAMFRRRLNEKGEAFLLLELEESARATLHAWIEETQPQLYLQLALGDKQIVMADQSQCAGRLATLTSEPASMSSTSDPAAAPWPYIRKIKVYLKAHILGKGLVLVDLPGLGDLNSARQDITTRYLLDCDEIFAVCPIGRAINNERVEYVIQLAQQTNLSSVGIICTRSDEIVPEEAVRDAHDPTAAARAQQLIDSMLANKQRQDQLKSSQSDYLELAYNDMDDTEKQKNIELAQALNTLERAIKRDELELYTIVVQDRNAHVLRQLRDTYCAAFPSIHSASFCTSSTDYWDYRALPKDKALPMLRLSGILAVRTHCLAMVADNQLRIITKYIHNDVPALLGDVALWVESGSGGSGGGGATSEKTRLRQILNDAEATLQLAMQGQDSLIRGTPQFMKDGFDVALYSDALSRCHEWTAHAREAAKRWDQTLYHVSYSALCRKDGYHTVDQNNVLTPYNWNEEVVKTMAASLKQPWADLVKILGQHQADIDALVRNAMTELTASIGSSGTNGLRRSSRSSTNRSTATLCWTLDARKAVFAADVKQSFFEFDNNIEALKTCALSGLHMSFMTEALKPAYKSCRNENGAHSHDRKKKIMNAALARPELFKTLLHDFRIKYGSSVDHFDAALQETVQRHLQTIQETLNTFRSEAVASESQKNPEFRGHLAAEVAAIRTRVAQIQEVFSK